MIERCRDGFPVRLMCRCLKVSVSGYSNWSKRLPSAGQLENQCSLDQIRALHEDSRRPLLAEGPELCLQRLLADSCKNSCDLLRGQLLDRGLHRRNRIA